MTAESIHIPDINRQIVAGLPLNVQRAVHRIGKLIVPRIIAQIEGRRITRAWRCNQHWGPDYLKPVASAQAFGRTMFAGFPEGCAAARSAAVPHGFSNVGLETESVFTKGCDWLIPNRPARHDVLCSARREVREKFAAVVIHSPARANHEFVVEHLRAPGHADARRKSPLASRESRVTHAGCRGLRIISGDDQAVRNNCVRRWIVGVFRRIEIEEVAIFLRQAAVPIPTQTRGDGQIGPHLKLILDVFAGLVGAQVAIGVSNQQGGDVVIIIRREIAHHKAGEIRRRDRAQLISSSRVLSCV